MKLIFILFILINLSLLSKPKQEPTSKTKSKTYIANLTKVSDSGYSLSSINYCTMDTKKLYRGSEWRIGDKRVYSKSEIHSGTILGNGQEKINLLSVIQEIDTCSEEDFQKKFPQQQIRSDWLPPENREDFKVISWTPGLTTESRLKTLSYIFMDKIEIVQKDILSKTEKENQIKVTVENPFDFDLPESTLQVHYESSRGKPFPLYKSHKIPSLKSNQKKTILIDRKITEKGYNFNLNDVKLNADTSDFWIELYLSFH